MGACDPPRQHRLSIKMLGVRNELLHLQVLVNGFP